MRRSGGNGGVKPAHCEVENSNPTRGQLEFEAPTVDTPSTPGVSFPTQLASRLPERDFRLPERDFQRGMRKAARRRGRGAAFSLALAVVAAEVVVVQRD